MKSLITIASIAVLSWLLVSNKSNQKITSYHALKTLRTNGAITSMTGAPGENNCTNCHGGGTLDGNNGMNELSIVGGTGNEYVPGETLSMEFEMTAGGAKNGFQLVVLNADNEFAGEFIITDPAQTQLIENAGLGRSYVTHNTGGASASSWTFDWVTPAVGGNVTFYVASNESNNNNNSGGDLIYLSQHTFTADDLTNTTEEKVNFDFGIAYLRNKSKINLDVELSNASDVFFNLVDLKGSSVYSANLGAKNAGEFKEVINLKNNLENGIYVATLFFNNKPVSKKFMVQ
jgi:hypothetical protein